MNRNSVNLIRQFLLVAAISLSGQSAVFGVEFYKNCVQHFSGAICKIRISGPIVTGDAASLRALLRMPEHKDAYETGILELDSPGGDVYEALKIVALMKEWIGTASVEGNAECASACFIIWIGSPMHAQSRVGSNAGKIGLHRPYFDKLTYRKDDVEKIARNQSEVMLTMRKFLEGENLSQRLIDEMMRRASNDIYWLTNEDFEEIGVHSPYLEEMSIQYCGNTLKGTNQLLTSLPASEYNLAKLKFLKCVDDMAKKRRPPVLRSN